MNATIYNATQKENSTAVSIKAQDFMAVVKELHSYAHDLIEQIPCCIHWQDTVPGKLAGELVKGLGYNSVEEFFNVHEP